jgi:hypothetical protein
MHIPGLQASFEQANAHSIADKIPPGAKVLARSKDGSEVVNACLIPPAGQRGRVQRHRLRHEPRALPHGLGVLRP